jgi:hypothetical protein
VKRGAYLVILNGSLHDELSGMCAPVLNVSAAGAVRDLLRYRAGVNLITIVAGLQAGVDIGAGDDGSAGERGGNDDDDGGSGERGTHDDGLAGESVVWR